MRTPAEKYFGPEGFDQLLEALSTFGQEKLGCTAISPPWLSVYVDGCEQRYHTDSWHGPWAFVLSLTGEHVVSFFVGVLRAVHLFLYQPAMAIRVHWSGRVHRSGRVWIA